MNTTNISQAVVLQVDWRHDPCSSYFDDDFPFLLQGKVDPERYATTLQGATRRLQSGNKKAWFCLVLFAILAAPFIVLFSSDVTILWLALLIFAFMTICVSISTIAQARRSVDGFLREENKSYYNPLGVNLKYHRQYRSAWIAVEIVFNHDAPKIDETAPAQQEQQQQEPVVQCVYTQPECPPSEVCTAPTITYEQQQSIQPVVEQQQPYAYAYAYPYPYTYPFTHTAN